MSLTDLKYDIKVLNTRERESLKNNTVENVDTKSSSTIIEGYAILSLWPINSTEDLKSAEVQLNNAVLRNNQVSLNYILYLFTIR